MATACAQIAKENKRTKCARLGRKKLHFCTECKQIFCIDCLTATFERVIAPAVTLFKLLERAAIAKEDGETERQTCPELNKETVTSTPKSLAIFGNGEIFGKRGDEIFGKNEGDVKTLSSGARRLMVFGDRDPDTLNDMDSVVEAFTNQLKAEKEFTKENEKLQLTKLAAKLNSVMVERRQKKKNG